MGIVNSGLNDLANSVVGNSATTYDNMAVGDGAIGFSAFQTALISEDIRKTTTNTNSVTTIGTVNKRIVLETTDIPGNNISEVGALSDSSGGTMLNRIVFSPTLHAGTSQTRITVSYRFQR